MGIFFDGIFSGKEELKSNCGTNSQTKSALEEFLNSNGTFEADISDGVANTDTNMCINNGIQFHDIPGMIKLVYSGLLAQNGAKQVYAEVGYGRNEHWEETETLPMQKTAQKTFELLTFRKKAGSLFVAFKDDTGNWDNNSGLNYIFSYEKGNNGLM